MQNHETFFLTDRAPDAPIAFCSRGVIHVDQLLAQAVALSLRLPPRRYVINLHTDRYRYLIGFCAAAIAGQCTLMPSNRLPNTIRQVAQQYPDSYTLDESEENLADRPGSRKNVFPEVAANQPGVIAFTSGSTGKPRPNLKSWRTLREGSLSNARLLLDGTREPLNLLATVPPQHMWGMEMSILLPLFAEAAISYRTPFFPRDISDALAALPEPRALISSPVHLKAFLRSGVDAVALERIFTATAPLPEPLARDLEARFDTIVTDVFGCSESGVLAARHPSRDPDWRVADAFEVITGDDGAVVRARHLPEDVALPDFVEITGDRRFRWLGRHEDMINIAGKRGSLAELNYRLNAMPGVIDGVMFMPEDSERLAALVVAPELSVAGILRYLRSHIEPVFLPRPLCLVQELPRQETGKLPRKLVLELFRSVAEKRGKPALRASDERT